MVFNIEYTSGNGKPCKNAVGSFDAIEGNGHVWKIEINTLDELMEIKNEVGYSLIIHKYDDEEIPTIEVYNSYRE